MKTIYKPKGFEAYPVNVFIKGVIMYLVSIEEDIVIMYDTEARKIKEIDLDDEGSNWIEWRGVYKAERMEMGRIWHEYLASEVKG